MEKLDNVVDHLGKDTDGLWLEMSSSTCSKCLKSYKPSGTSFTSLDVI